MHYSELNRELGNIDLFLLDQILKGRFDEGMKVLDAGCGEGRNLSYFVNNGFEVFGVDSNPMAIKMAKMTYRSVPADNWIVSSIEEIPFKDSFYDLVMCHSVLHFAKSETHFFQIVQRLIGLIKPGGFMSFNMASTIGFENEFLQNPGSFQLSQKVFDNLLKNYEMSEVEPARTVLTGEACNTYALLKRY